MSLFVTSWRRRNFCFFSIKVGISAWVMSIIIMENCFFCGLQKIALKYLSGLGVVSKLINHYSDRHRNNKLHEEISFVLSLALSLIFNARIKIPQQHQPTNISITFWALTDRLCCYVPDAACFHVVRFF